MCFMPNPDLDKEPERIEIPQWEPRKYSTEPQVEHVAAKFCSNACRELYREERINGIEQPTSYINGKEISFNELCSRSNQCCQCLQRME
jgi:hypothetical protein